VKVTWVARECSIRQGTLVCGGIDEGAELDIRDKDKVVDGIPSTDGWANRTYESGVGAVLEVFHRTQAKRLAGVVGIS